MSICCVTQEAQPRALWQPGGVGWGGVWEGGWRGRGYMYIYGWLIYADVMQKQAHCEAVILQIKNKFKKRYWGKKVSYPYHDREHNLPASYPLPGIIYQVKVKLLSRVQLFVNPVDCSLHQASPSMGFSRQEYQSGLPFPSGDLPYPGIEPRSLALQADSLPSEPQGSLYLLKGIY